MKNIKRFWGKKQLSKTINQKRKAISCNYYEMGKIGIIYDATKEENVKAIKNIVSQIKAENKEVTSFGFVNSKEFESYHTQPQDFHFFKLTDLNWYQMPISDEILEFCNTEFGVLIDLTTDFCLPLRFVLNKSKALLKLGMYSEENVDYYDISIDISSDPQINFLFEQSMHYLKMINKRTAL
ncbi:MAG: hypothetical protein GX879_06965 [Bacteroidales bacterium]|nr:hypothetical protein [Bacteroidales bacterium]